MRAWRLEQVVLIIFIFSRLIPWSAFSLEVWPSNPNPGDMINITGSASPHQTVSLRSSFSMNLPVAGGQYEYETKLRVPQTPNRFKITAKKVKDFNAGIKLGIWITKSFSASSGTVSLSQANVPAGSYSLKMFGEALPGSAVIPVWVEAETEVKADSEGRYSLDIDTLGIPAGEYRIEAVGQAKTIQIGKASSATSSSPRLMEDYGEIIQVNTPAKPVEITPSVICWYANKIGLEVENSSQLGRAEKLLLKRLEDGYWKVIARGEPLTEQAGNCMQEYCLVRGGGACAACREKDIISKGNLSIAPGLESTDLNSSENHSQFRANGEKTGLWSTIMERIGRWLGILAGGV